ncbi:MULTISPECIES: formylglycine-generating enzyme family protein [unclassified Kaistella]|uniref:formylglycine-generating enzyme family protein n=1 Tax=unclassified Kaistella TaxID=2762626 RepID=UPI002732AD7F|nr:MULTISPECIES: formylglycine-generating enzyme family protein [unclassified Kaistella]MDP2454281.1 formylglycine-generating enzyme family protein [Kaistella sp. SH11-4b]MDP2457648.1 formylglycine-generating enzyme family protein [Kaistella sp. SH40-3]MDP2460406.1 formylglycine-generating enzyme family protein [Kaistella sp. SH19-2b]
MSKIFKILMFVGGFFFLLVSCEKANTLSTKKVSSDTVEKEVAINPDVKMVLIKGGDYQPFYGTDSTLVKVEDFLLDERPVTNAEFLDFVKKNPKWKRSNIKAIFADDTYLKDWQDDETLPKNADPNAAVTYVSWFAAKAYAKSAGKRLPTLDEWEYVAMADEETPNAREKPTYSAHLINLYNEKDRQKNKVKISAPNFYGVYNMFDLVWEWTDDFNSIMTTSDSRTAEFDDKGLFCASAATSTTDVLNYASFMRYAFRSSLKANYTVGNLGFRCAKDLSNTTK